MAVKEPKYQILLNEPPYQVRQYEPTVIAETVVNGSLSEATNRGFRLLADFIFGNNISVAKADSEKISMTAPVTIESEKVDIKTPVSIAQWEAHGRWRVQFTMPSRYTLATLPKPRNDAVKVRDIPAKIYAVIAFSGLVGEKKVREKMLLLNQWCHDKQFQLIGSPQLARYDPPWKLPFWRRNEVLLEIDLLAQP